MRPFLDDEVPCGQSRSRLPAHSFQFASRIRMPHVFLLMSSLICIIGGCNGAGKSTLARELQDGQSVKVQEKGGPEGSSSGSPNGKN